MDAYAKRPLRQWILIYAVVGLVIYALIYFIVVSRMRIASASPGAIPQTQNTY